MNCIKQIMTDQIYRNCILLIAIKLKCNLFMVSLCYIKNMKICLWYVYGMPATVHNIHDTC